MQCDVFHGARSRERIAPNLYRRTTKSGRSSLRRCSVIRTVASERGVSTLAPRRAAIREARALLAQCDGGDRVVPADVTVRAFAVAEYLPLLDSLAAAGRRSARGVALDRDQWRLYVNPRSVSCALAPSRERTSPACSATSALVGWLSQRSPTRSKS